jgi:hypothetical protein
MSYSRWGDSRWYTYWLASERAATKEREVFEICGVTNFTYYEIKHDQDRVLDEVRMKDPDASDDEIEELRVYMKQFLVAIDAYYERLK